jgi:hypothetical protein
VPGEVRLALLGCQLDLDAVAHGAQREPALRVDGITSTPRQSCAPSSVDFQTFPSGVRQSPGPAAVQHWPAITSRSLLDARRRLFA